MLMAPQGVLIHIKLRMPVNVSLQSECGGEAPCSKGKQPRPSIKVPKFMLSVKRCRDAQTTRMLAQKQLPFKECVTAH